MKWRKRFLVAIALGLSVIPLSAQIDLYDNGPSNGTTDGWTLNFGYAVSDSFTLSFANTVQGLMFTAWLLPGDTLMNAEVSITSDEFGGMTYFDQVVNFTQSGCVGNQYGYNVCTETGTFSDVELPYGTYWLNLQNANVNTGDPVYWDENSGPSQASNNSIGTIPSESFTVLGAGCTCCQVGANCGPPSPEPGSFVLLSSGAIALFGMLGGLRRFF